MNDSAFTKNPAVKSEILYEVEIPMTNAVFPDMLEVLGAREHNLKNIDINIPRNKLVVITGLSGSGKSSLAFDTLYAEGQRRYVESFSTYARQFLGTFERPDADKITGLSPVIAIEQKTTSKNPRSTVGTTTEIYDFMRLLFAKVADAYSYNTGEKMIRFTDEQIINMMYKNFTGQNVLVLSPVVKGRKGHYRELLQSILRQGFLRARIDGEIQELKNGKQLDRYKIHDIEIVIDRLRIEEKDKKRLVSSLETAMKYGKGTILILPEDNKEKAAYLSRHLMCPTTGIAYAEPEPNSFSFNSPYGACHRCNGLGHISEIDEEKLITPGLSIERGGIAPIGKIKNTWIFRQLEALGDKYGFNLGTPLKNIPEEAVKIILYGTDEMLKIKNISSSNSKHISTDYILNFEGIVNFLLARYQDDPSPYMKKWIQGFMNNTNCPECNGTRLQKEALYFRIDDKNIAEVSNMDIDQLADWINHLEERLTEKQALIADGILKELKTRVQFLRDVGLAYLALNRTSGSLSGGESQRIRLATQIGSQLVGVLYILDEPSIGLHQSDNSRLINSLKKLRDSGNSVIVVEHDKQMILSSDHVIDIGPGAGIHGGHVVTEGPPHELNSSNSLTAQYLKGEKQIHFSSDRRKGNGNYLVLKGAKGNNLKDITVTFPLGKLICITGVSGSGKSTLINETLYPILNQRFYNSSKKPMAYDTVNGLEYLDKVIEIDQSPIGRTPRSNPATYTGVFTDIRNLFTGLPEAKIRGYKPGRFSFNMQGGRCDTCMGGGVKTIEMNFLPDIYVHCETCNGKRYNRETLEIRYKGKSISDVLEMSIDHAAGFFEHIPSIIQKIKTLKDVGLGYITLGQSSITLSGGEAQRVKLASELSKKYTGKTFYILDEPTTGLHFEDIRVLLEVLNKLVDIGNTVLVIEHNLDIIKTADHIIDLGPEGGQKGGHIICYGTPEKIAEHSESYTAQYLKKELFL